MMDAYKLAPEQNARNYDPPHKAFLGIATSKDPEFIRAIRQIDDWLEPAAYPNFILPVRPEHFDRRMAVQRSCFTFHVPEHPVLTTTHNSTLKRFHVPRAAKERIRKELAVLGIDTFSVYGDMEHLGETLVAAHAGLLSP